MTETTTRAAQPHDSKNYSDWLKAASDINLVDTKVYSYPTCNTVVVEQDGEPVLMNSFHAVLVMEALAPKPGLSPKDEALALRELYATVQRIADATGVREVWFMCADERLHKFIERRGFEKVNTAMFRITVGTDTRHKIKRNCRPLI
jgi:hypothetical protein